MSNNKHRDAAFATALNMTGNGDPLFNDSQRGNAFMRIYTTERIAQAIDRLTDAMRRNRSAAAEQDAAALAEAEEDFGK
jgi:hypothetical protein